MNDLLHSQKLKEIANKGTDIIFCLHLICNLLLIILMCQAMLRVLSKGYRCSEIDKSKLMITDYSSVAFDFSF